MFDKRLGLLIAERDAGFARQIDVAPKLSLFYRYQQFSVSRKPFRRFVGGILILRRDNNFSVKFGIAVKAVFPNQHHDVVVAADFVEAGGDVGVGFDADGGHGDGGGGQGGGR